MIAAACFSGTTAGGIADLMASSALATRCSPWRSGASRWSRTAAIVSSSVTAQPRCRPGS